MTHHTARTTRYNSNCITQNYAWYNTTPHYTHYTHCTLLVLRALQTPCRVTCTRAAQHAQSDTDTGLGILLFHGCLERNAVELVLLIQQFVVHFETPAQTEVRIVEQIVESSVSQVAGGPLFGLLSGVRILPHVTRQAHISKLVATLFSVSYHHNRNGDCSRRQTETLLLGLHSRCKTKLLRF